MNRKFELKSKYKPCGDQPDAIESLTESVREGQRYQTLLGVTGSGKTYTVANVIAQVQKPTLVISHNKTLAAQLCSEFRAFFPDSAVEYFVSYYDYYQPEAYIPQTDVYIEKDFSINEEIDRLRHRSTQALLTRKDVIVVASVSCIYGLGSPEEYTKVCLLIKRGQKVDRDSILQRLVKMQYERNDSALSRGRFRVRGDVIEICTVEESIMRIELEGEKVLRLSDIDGVTGNVIRNNDGILVFPARHFITPPEMMESAIKSIEKELEGRLKYFKKENKLLEAQRLEQRTRFDLEMIREVGYCSGIENYSRHFDGRPPGSPPFTLLDFFPKDHLMIIDESHVTVPQLRGMYAGDRSRKDILVEYGFRLPSARDNRPLIFDEFETRINQVIFVSATPGPYELGHSPLIAEQIIRPTGLVDPEIIVKPVKGQVDDLIGEIRKRAKKGERVLVTTLTKKMAEDLADYFKDLEIKVHYLHSEVETLKRVELLRDLRLGKYDVLVGINLLREGLDLPEVSLVAILDADREGFLRSEISLIQTIGRAARNVFGQVIMYADNVTGSMKKAIDETNRRRKLQLKYNEKHGITPQTVRKEVRAILEKPAAIAEATTTGFGRYAKDKLDIIVANLEEEMRLAAKNLEFEKAAVIRDRIKELNKAQDKVQEKIEWSRERKQKRRKGR